MNRSIWVVDDEPLIRAAVIAVLNELGYETRGFANAEELYIELVNGQERPQLIVLDQMLPDEDGATVVRSLREREEYRDIPVLFLTAVTEEQADRLGDLAPVVRKPFDFRDFVAAIEETLPPDAGDEADMEAPLADAPEASRP